MKKLFCLLCLLPVLAATGWAQETRQDVSLSFMGSIQPYVEGGTNNVRQTATLGTGALVSYRYMLTPNGAIEANYEYSRWTEKFVTSAYNARIHTSVQEASFAYVRSFVFKNFNPFIEGGGGILIFSPLGSIKTTTLDTEQKNSPFGMFGGGVAYELSPSWDLRVQYRGLVMKSQTFGLSVFDTGRYYIMSQPAVGFAYHF